MTTAERTPWTIAIEPEPTRPAEHELIETPDLDRLAGALTDPDAEQVLYRITYARVGRRGGRDGSTPPPPLTVWAMTADDLAEQIHRDIRQYLLSRDYDVTADLEAGRGHIFAGMRNGGTFTIERLASADRPAEAGQQSSPAAVPAEAAEELNTYRLGMHCDHCGTGWDGDFTAAASVTMTALLELVRQHARTELSWSCGPAGDFCPACCTITVTLA